MRAFTFTLGVALIVVISGCAAKRPRTICNLNTPQDPNYLFAPATATSQEMQLAIDKAADAARLEIAKQLETKMAGVSKRFQEEVGTGLEAEYLDMFNQTYKAVISTVLSGASVSKLEIQIEGGIFRAYVLMQMPLGTANQALMDRIKQQEQLYTRFRATQAYEELEKEVQDYEEWKANQGMGR